MLFTDLLNEKTKVLQPEFEKLFSEILDKQTHEGDLLMVYVNGFHNPDVYKWTNIPDKNPYMIGFGLEGHSDIWHYKFIHQYRISNLNSEPYEAYLKQFEFDPERIAELRKLEELEAMSIQLEMLIYLKIWEADLFIKRFYQLALLVNGEPYDWHFRIEGHNRDKKSSTGKRAVIIREKIRDRLIEAFPAIGNAIKNAYKTQIRNAIAHSTYFFSGRHIHLGNSDEDDPHSQIEVLPFDDWNSLFHDTMVIYNQMIGFIEAINDFYAKVASENNDLFPVRISRIDPEVKTEYVYLKYRAAFRDWGPNR